MIAQHVIDKTTKQVKRSGFTPFATDGTLDSGTEQVIEFGGEVLDLLDSDYYWNGSSFQTDPV